MVMWRLYAKFENRKRFEPIDWGRGVPVKNLIYATVFTEEEMRIADAEIKNIAGNEHIKFEWRRV